MLDWQLERPGLAAAFESQAGPPPAPAGGSLQRNSELGDHRIAAAFARTPPPPPTCPAGAAGPPPRRSADRRARPAQARGAPEAGPGGRSPGVVGSKEGAREGARETGKSGRRGPARWSVVWAAGGRRPLLHHVVEVALRPRGERFQVRGLRGGVDRLGLAPATTSRASPASSPRRRRRCRRGRSPPPRAPHRRRSPPGPRPQGGRGRGGEDEELAAEGLEPPSRVISSRPSARQRDRPAATKRRDHLAAATWRII